MSAFLDVLRMLGLRGGAIAAAACVLCAFYLLRAKSVGARAASMAAALVAYSVVSLFILAFALAAGWFEPNMGVISEHVHEAMRLALERGKAPARRFLRWVVNAAAGGGA